LRDNEVHIVIVSPTDTGRDVGRAIVLTIEAGCCEALQRVILIEIVATVASHGTIETSVAGFGRTGNGCVLTPGCRQL
jgi:hypothetical protein